MDKSGVIAPLQVRFVDPEDIEKYGDDWYTYDELDIITTPAKTLMLLEGEIGAPLAQVMDGVRESSIFGDTAGAWLALRFAGKSVKFSEFNPAIMLAQWRSKPAEEAPGKAEGPEIQTPAPVKRPRSGNSSTPAPSTDPVDTVTLQIMEPSESPS